MKITRDRSYMDNNGQIDYMSVINDLQDEYGTIYWNTIEGQVYIYRPLGRLEYKELLESEISDLDKEDAVCETCILHPENLNLDECPAGLPSQLFQLILKNSFLDSIESKKIVIAYHRNQMQQFDNQITCIINEAFPNYDIEEIENWDMSKTAKYLSRAEWKLNVLRQIPIDYEKSDQLMEQEWNTQHASNTEEDFDDIQQQEDDHQSPAPKNDFKVETLEERQARLAKEGPRKKSPEELARLKSMFPEINWDAEIDPTGNLDNMRDNLDVTAPALRTGF